MGVLDIVPVRRDACGWQDEADLLFFGVDRLVS